MKFCSGGMLEATRVKMSDSEKRVKLEHDIPSTKRVTRKFLEVSRNSRAKQRQRNVQKKVCCTCKVAFLLIRPIVVVVFFLPFSLPSPLSINDFIFCLSTDYKKIIESFAFSPG